MTIQESQNQPCSSLTKREIAAIELRVPDSGLPWLDEMILRAKRDELAARAMEAMLGSDQLIETDMLAIANESFMCADAMPLAAGKESKP